MSDFANALNDLWNEHRLKGVAVDKATLDSWIRYAETPVPAHRKSALLASTEELCAKLQQGLRPDQPQPHMTTALGHGLERGDIVNLTPGPVRLHVVTAVLSSTRFAFRPARRWEVWRYRLRSLWGRVCRKAWALADRLYLHLGGVA